MEKLVERPYYIEKLNKLKVSPDLVKIITGIRRCGKSKLLEMFRHELIINDNVSDNRIISINLEDIIQTQKIGLKFNTNKLLGKYEILLSFIMEKLHPNKMNYVFIDEIQLLENWQQVANALRLQENVDLYITGSNAYMFSSDLANTFGGRYIEIKMQPYTFKEYFSAYKMTAQFTARTKQDFINNDSLDYVFQKYIKESGFPQTVNAFWDRQMINDYLMDVVYNNTVQKDIVKRFKLENDENLNRVVNYLFDNIGNEVSNKNIINSLASAGRKTSTQSIDTYIKGLTDSYLLYECKRYDIKGKQFLNNNSKYYVADIGLRTALLGKEDTDIGHILENIVYLELINRGYKVSVGKISKVVKKNGKSERKTIEIDFVATKAGGTVEYYQVALYALEEKTLEREIAPLEEIDDNYPKFLLSMDFDEGQIKGIKRINILNWLTDFGRK